MANNLIILPPANRNQKRPFLGLSWRNVKRLCKIVLVLLFIAYVGLHVGVKIYAAYVESHFPDRYASIREFWKSNINFPKEWERLGEDSEERRNIRNDPNHPFRQLQNAFSKWTTSDRVHSCIRLIQNPREILSQEDWDTIRSTLDELAGGPLAEMDALRQLKQEIVKIPATDYILPLIEWYDRSQLQQRAKLKVVFLAREGKFGDALALQIAALYLHVFEPIPTYGPYVGDRDRMSEAIARLSDCAATVWEEQSLQTALDDLNRLEPYLFRMKKEYVQLYPLFARLDRFHLPIHYGKNVKAYEYCWNVKNGEFPLIGIKTILSRYYDRLLIGQELQNNYRPWGLEIELLRHLLLTRTLEELIMTMTYDSWGVKNYEKELGIGNQYDRVRLTIAGKLYFLRNQKYPTGMADLVPAYFPAELKDRLTGQPVAVTGNANN